MKECLELLRLKNRQRTATAVSRRAVNEVGLGLVQGFQLFSEVRPEEINIGRSRNVAGTEFVGRPEIDDDDVLPLLEHSRGLIRRDVLHRGWRRGLCKDGKRGENEDRCGRLEGFHIRKMKREAGCWQGIELTNRAGWELRRGFAR